MATDGAWKIRTGAHGVLASSWETQDEVEWLVTIIPRASVIPRALSRCSKPDFFSTVSLSLITATCSFQGHVSCLPTESFIFPF